MGTANALNNRINIPTATTTAFSITDPTNTYLSINSTAARPRSGFPLESTITGPLTMNGGYCINWPGGVYNSTAALSASQSGTTVTGSGTNFPSGCEGGFIYWPSTQQAAVIQARVSGTQLTVDLSQTQALAPFVIYYAGLNIDYAGLRQLQGQSLWTNIIDTPPSSVGQGTTLSIGPTNATAVSLVPALSLTTPLSAASGGTGVNNGSNTTTLAGNLATSGANSLTLTTTGTTNVTLPTSGTLATTAQIPTGAALTKADDTNVTLTLGGSPTTALVNAASVTAGWTGQLSAARGGTGANNTATTGTILRGNGTNFVPTTATYPATATGTGTILRADGTNWSATTATYPATATSTGTVLRADGTNWSATTATYPNTTTTNQLLYSSATNTVGGLATAANGTLVTDGSSVPSISSTLPSAVQNNITAVNSGANALSIGGSTKTFTSGAANIPTFSAITSWTPGIAFGGGTTGITYSSQTGFYRTITYPNGTIEVAVWGSVNLSNKGSSTGAATLTGLPVTTGPNGTSNLVPFSPASITVAAGALGLLQINNSTTTANIDTTNMNGGGFAQVNNTQFSNSSSVAFNFTYWNN